MLNFITWFMNQVMLLGAAQQARAERYERTDTRKAHQNGYKDRSLKTRYSETVLKKLQLWRLLLAPVNFGQYARVGKALANAIAESYLQGTSTRKSRISFSIFGIEQRSPSSVSRMAKDLNSQVQAFLQRPIEQEVPYLFVDTSYCRVRDRACYVTKSLLMTASARDDGYREVLITKITDCKSEEFWLRLSEKTSRNEGLTASS